MNRRRFLHLLGLGAASVAVAPLVPDLDLWVPGQKTFFLPPTQGWHPPWLDPLPPGTYLVTPEFITREAFRVLHHNLKFAQRVNRQ